MKTETMKRKVTPHQYAVHWEGTEPYFLPHDEAFVELWAAHFLRVPCWLKHPACDPGRTDATQLDRTQFRLVPEHVKKSVGRELARNKLDCYVADLCVGLGMERPELQSQEDCDGRNWYLRSSEGIECWCGMTFGLTGFCRRFTVGIDTGEDFIEVLETHDARAAALRMAVLHYESTARRHVKELDCE